MVQIAFLSAALLLTQATAFQSQKRCNNPNCHRICSRDTRNHLHRLTTTSNLLEDYFQKLSFLPSQTTDNGKTNSATTTVEAFFNACSQKDATEALSMFALDGVFENAAYSKPCVGKDELERRLRLEFDATSTKLIIDGIAVENAKVCVKFHAETATGEPVDSGRGRAFFNSTMAQRNRLSESFGSPSRPRSLAKTGSASWRVRARLLRPRIGETNPLPRRQPTHLPERTLPRALARVHGSLHLNNTLRRDMELAVSAFADTVTYYDTVFPEEFSGEKNVRKHLLKCADAFPPTFTFEVDDIVNGGDWLVVVWHVENGDEPLPFTRGCSFYELDSKGRIHDGIDFVEPGPAKLGGPALFSPFVGSNVCRLSR